MKKSLFRFFTLMLMMFMMFTTTTFASENVLVSMTSVEFLAKSNDEGIITLTEDIVLSDSLKTDKNYTVDLNGHTLKFTAANNYFVNGANVTFKNGTINLDGIKGSGDCILGVGNYGSSAKLTLDNVNVQANNYTSPYALIYVYNDSTLNIENNSSVNAKNEKSLSGGVIKTSKGQAGRVNITNSTLNFENTARGFVDGTINVKNSEVSMNGLANGINSSNVGLSLTVDNSDVIITGSIGSALKINNSQVNVVNDSKLDLSKSLAGDIQFASKGTVSVDKSSELNVDKIKLDDSIKGTGLDELIVSEGYTYIVDDKGNVTKVCKHVNTEIVYVEAATCSKEGYTGDKICSDCGEVLEKGNVIPKLEHKVEVKGEKEATCKEEGYTGDKICSDCGEVLEKGNVIPKLEHKVAVIHKEEATCKKEGKTEGKSCSVCNEVIEAQQTIPVISHVFNHGEVTVKPTHDNTGMKTYTCTICGETKTEVLDKINTTDNVQDENVQVETLPNTGAVVGTTVILILGVLMVACGLIVTLTSKNNRI